MKHFSDDEEYDSMKEYEFNIMRHDDDNLGSMLPKGVPEDEDDYGSILFKHWQEDY